MQSALNTAAFYVVAALVVVAAGAAVAYPVQRVRLAALVAALLLVSVLLALVGALAIAVTQAAIAAAFAGAVLLSARRADTRPALLDMRRSADAASLRRLWPAIPAAALLCVLVAVFAASASGWHQGSGLSRLITVFHDRAPYALAVAVALGVTAVGVALMAGRTGDDERSLDRSAEARRQREERERRRREDREQARRRGAVSTGGDG